MVNKAINSLVMSQEARNKQSGDRDINRTSNAPAERKNYEGFEGMNYEQIRQPYNPKHVSRNRSNDERKEEKSTDSM